MKRIAFGALICVKGASKSNWIIVIIATSKNASGLLRGVLNVFGIRGF